MFNKPLETMQVTAEEIAQIINGHIIGNPKMKVSSFSSIMDAKKGDISFLSDYKYKQYIESTQASILITDNSDINIKKSITVIQVSNPLKKFIEILHIYFIKTDKKKGISLNSDIHKSSSLGQNVLIDSFCIIEKDVIIGDNTSIHPNTFIGERVIIGSNCNIGPNVSIYHDSKIGHNCIIHAGVVIGSDGFGFTQEENIIEKIPQIGKVIIHNNVEIGANSTIDRGALSNTIIHNDVKLDNLIQIGHNVEIGQQTLIAAHTAIAGSSKIGEKCMIGGQVAIAGHLHIGNNVKIAGKSGVIKNIKSNTTIQGPMAYNMKDFQKSYVHFKNLPNIVSNINLINKYIETSTNNQK